MHLINAQNMEHIKQLKYLLTVLSCIMWCWMFQ